MVVFVDFASFGPLLIGASHTDKIWIVVALVVLVILFGAMGNFARTRPDGIRLPGGGRYWHIGRLRPEPPREGPPRNDPSGYDGD